MKTIFFIFMLSVPFFCKAQTGTAKTDTSQTDTISTSHEQYCSVIVTARALSTHVNVFVDFGTRKYQRLKDADGKIIKFSSDMAALNYMAARGWVLVGAFRDSNGPYYIMRKSAK